MARKFIIVKPLICCKYTDLIGKIYESCSLDDSTNDMYYCQHCYDNFPINKPVATMYKGVYCLIDESLIRWLPDESDIITHDMRIEENV